MGDTPANLRETLQDSLDIVSMTKFCEHPRPLIFVQLVSARSSTTARSRAIGRLECLITKVHASPGGSPTLQEFLSLQNTFECNGEPKLVSVLFITYATQLLRESYHGSLEQAFVST